MQRTTTVFSATIGAALLLAIGSTSFAEQIIEYGDFDNVENGGAILYVEVSESTSSLGDTVPLYGPPEVSDLAVNKLDFDPQVFGSTVSGADGIDQTVGQLNLGIEMLPGSGLTALSIMEGGTFSFFPSGLATELTSVGYGLTATLTILEVDGVPLEEAIIVTENEAEEINATEPATLPVLGAPWSLSVFLDLGPALSDLDFEYGVTKAELVIDNTLASSSETGTGAFIDKTEFMITPFGDLVPDPMDVPEPVAATLLAVGLAALALRRR